MAREWDYFSGIESMTHCMPRENRSARHSLVFSVGGPSRGRTSWSVREGSEGPVSASQRDTINECARCDVMPGKSSEVNGSLSSARSPRRYRENDARILIDRLLLRLSHRIVDYFTSQAPTDGGGRLRGRVYFSIGNGKALERIS